LDYCLVSNENLVKKLALAVGAQGLMTSTKMPEPTPLMTSPSKNLKSKTFQFVKNQTRRLAASFEGLDSSLNSIAW